MNAIHLGRVPLSLIIAAGLCIAACDKPPAESKALVGPAIPLVARADNKQGSIPIDAGGIATRYTPEFAGDSLVRIEEERVGGKGRGTYAFQGARLLRYEGAPVEGTGALLLEFDLQGKTLTARNGSASATEEEIDAIRARAQLLRNHALAQHAARTHPMH